MPSLDRRLILTLALAAALALLVSCGHGTGTATPALQQATGTGPVAGTVQITTSTTLYPAFDQSISDYVIGTPSRSTVQVSVRAPTDTQVSVDGQPFRTFAFTTQVKLAPGQRFTLTITAPGSSKAYNIRCLPTDFPSWLTERPGTPQAEYFVFAPNMAVIIGAGTPRNYVIIADANGVPLWWFRSAGVPIDAILLPNGNVAWISSAMGEEHNLDGATVRTFTADSSIGGTLDIHELQLLSNGDYLSIANVTRGPVDLSPYGGAASAMVVDNVIEEIAPNRSLVWHWSAMDHIPVSETDPIWRSQYIVKASPADPYHMNSVESNGNGFVASFRHLNAVIRIDKASGNIVWKLGGSPRPESLTFNGDAYGNFGGQHDARVLPDGTLTVHDNGSLQGRAPRAVRYSIDTNARTATLVEQVTDPDVSSSLCCGSARKLTGGDWVMSWGLNPIVTELTPAGTRVFRMTFQNPPYYSYRAEPVPFGVLSRPALREGMDAQFPR